MGTLRSAKDHTGLIVNEITLGEPAQDTDDDGETIEGSEYRWDDSRIPSGTLDEHGELTLDEEEI